MSLNQVDLGGAFANFDRPGQLSRKLTLEATGGGAARLIAPQIAYRIPFNAPFSVDVVGNGLLAHGSHEVKAMAAAQNDLDLLGRRPRGG